MEQRVKLTEEMAAIATRARQEARPIKDHGESIREFWSLRWPNDDNCLAKRINNAGLTEQYKKLNELALLVDTAKDVIMAARRQLRIDAKEVYETDLPERVKNGLVDYGCRTRMDMHLAKGYSLRRIKGWGKKSNYELLRWSNEHWTADYKASLIKEVD